MGDKSKFYYYSKKRERNNQEAVKIETINKFTEKPGIIYVMIDVNGFKVSIKNLQIKWGGKEIYP